MVFFTVKRTKMPIVFNNESFKVRKKCVQVDFLEAKVVNFCNFTPNPPN
jgi:hypothetical protein